MPKPRDGLFTRVQSARVNSSGERGLPRAPYQPSGLCSSKGSSKANSLCTLAWS